MVRNGATTTNKQYMLQELKDRWKSESPVFFKKVTAIAISIGSSATAVWLANSTMNLQLPEVLMSVCKYAIAASAAMGLTSKLTKNTPNT